MAELGAGQTRFLEVPRVGRLRNPVDQFGLATARRRPRLQAGTPTQSVGGAERHGRASRVAVSHCQLSGRDEREGHGQRAQLGVVACIDRPYEQRPRLLEPTSPHLERRQLGASAGPEPEIVEPAAELVDHREVHPRCLFVVERHLHHPDGQRGERDERVVLKAEAVECHRGGTEGAVEVVEKRQDP